MGDITRILNAITQGEPGKMDELLALVYGELRKLASHKMASQAAGQTLQPTALVHEAWLRLAADDKPRFQDRQHFFASAAEAMRHILIDNARKKTAQRRGGEGMRKVELDGIDVALPSNSEQLLDLDEALEKLTAERPLEAKVVKLRFFVGMTIEEAAEVLEISPRTAKNYWAYAKAWLYREIKAARQ
jgi:RNA polymerase sigma factor (TIGR02999 family)